MINKSYIGLMHMDTGYTYMGLGLQLTIIFNVDYFLN